MFPILLNLLFCIRERYIVGDSIFECVYFLSNKLPHAGYTLLSALHDATTFRSSPSINKNVPFYDVTW